MLFKPKTGRKGMWISTFISFAFFLLAIIVSIILGNEHLIFRHSLPIAIAFTYISLGFQFFCKCPFCKKWIILNHRNPNQWCRKCHSYHE